MKAKYDSNADALYIEIKDGKFYRNHLVDENTILDIDKQGNIIGIELLFIRERNPKFLKEIKGEW